MSYTRTNLGRFLVLVTFGSALAACGDSGTAPPRGDLRNLVYCENPDVRPPSEVCDGYSLADDSALRMKLEGCAVGGCHGNPGTPGVTWTLDLSGSSAQSALSRLSTTIGLSGDYVVDEFDPDCSNMLTKVTDMPAGGSRMPFAPPYWSSAEVDCFRSYLHELYPSVTE